MMTIDQQIRMLAAAGRTPYEIEEELGMKHYTIHIAHHRALMAGYEKSFSSYSASDKQYQKDYYARKREWIAYKKKLRREEVRRMKEQANGQEQKAA